MKQARATKKKVQKSPKKVHECNSPIIRPDYRVDNFVSGCLNPVNPLPTVASIIRLGAQDRYAEALTAVKRLGGDRSLDPTVRLLTAELYIAAGRIIEASIVFDIEAKIDRFNPEPAIIRGIAAKRCGLSSEALIAFRKAIEKDRKFWLPHYFAAEMLRLLVREAQALDEYKTTVAILAETHPTTNGLTFPPLAPSPAVAWQLTHRHILELGGTDDSDDE